MTGLGQSIYDKAYAEACTKTTVNLLLSLVKDGLLNLSEAAKRANMSEEQFSELLKENN